MQVSRAIAAAQGGPLLPAARGAASRRADRQPRLVVRAGTDKKEEVVTGVSFKPFEEVRIALGGGLWLLTGRAGLPRLRQRGVGSARPPPSARADAAAARVRCTAPKSSDPDACNTPICAHYPHFE